MKFSANILLCLVALSGSFLLATAQEIDSNCSLTSVSAFPSEDVSRIVGGRTAQNGQFPHVVQFYIDFRDPNDGQDKINNCAGTIISPYWILTAAHCFFFNSGGSARNHRILAGNVNRYQGVQRSISDTIIHENYRHSSSGSPNDIALLRLREPLDLSQNNIKRACLPKPFQGQQLGGTVDASGWGDLGNGQSANVLQYTGMRIVPNSRCNHNVIYSQGCLQSQNGGRQGTCGGDSGGSIDAIVNGVKYHYGIVSYGPRPCGTGHDVFTRTSEYIRWIEERTGNLGGC